MPRRIRCDLGKLLDAFDAPSYDLRVYFDLDTGDVIHITLDLFQVLEDITAELPETAGEGEAYEAAFASALEQRDLPTWESTMCLREAAAVEHGLGTRFLRLPERDSRERYGELEAFIATISDPRLADRLWAAIRGRGAFRRVKAVLADYPAEVERWHAFKAARTRERVVAWLAEEGIEPEGQTG